MTNDTLSNHTRKHMLAAGYTSVVEIIDAQAPRVRQLEAADLAAGELLARVHAAHTAASSRLATATALLDGIAHGLFSGGHAMRLAHAFLAGQPAAPHVYRNQVGAVIDGQTEAPGPAPTRTEAEEAAIAGNAAATAHKREAEAARDRAETRLAEERTLHQKTGARLDSVVREAHRACLLWERTENHSLDDIKKGMSALRALLGSPVKADSACTEAEQAVLDAMAAADIRRDRDGYPSFHDTTRVVCEAELARRGLK